MKLIQQSNIDDTIALIRVADANGEKKLESRFACVTGIIELPTTSHRSDTLHNIKDEISDALEDALGVKVTVQFRDRRRDADGEVSFDNVRLVWNKKFTSHTDEESS